MKRILDRGVLTPAFLHFFAFVCNGESGSPVCVLLGSLAATFASALLAGASFFIPGALVAALWVPSVISAWDIYGFLESVSPHAPAQALIGMLGVTDQSGGRWSHIGLSAVVAVAALILVGRSQAFRKALRGFSWRDLGSN